MRNEDPEGVKLSSVLNPSCAWILRLVFKKCDFKLYLYIFIYMLVSVFLPVSVFFQLFCTGNQGCAWILRIVFAERLPTFDTLSAGLQFGHSANFYVFIFSEQIFCCKNCKHRGPVYSEMFSPQRSPTPHR